MTGGVNGVAVTRQQMIAMLEILGIPEDQMDTVKHISMDPRSVRIVRAVRVAGGMLVGPDGPAEHIEERPIDWRTG